MTIEFMEGCYCNTSDLHFKWDYVAHGPTVVNQLTNWPYAPRRSNSNCIKMGNDDILDHDLYDNSGDEWVIGFAYRQDSFKSSPHLYPIFKVSDVGGEQIRVYFESDGSARVMTPGYGGNTYASGIGVIENLVWQYFEFKFKIHNTEGYFNLRVNEVSVLSRTGIDTSTTASSIITKVSFRGSTANWYFQDLYINKVDGGPNSDFLGDVRVDIIRPNAAGDSTDFIPSDNSNYENVDDGGWVGDWPSAIIACDEDGSYNDSDFIDAKDLYNLGSISNSEIIFGILHNSIIRKTDAGSWYGRQLIKSGTTEIFTRTYSLNDSYTGYQHIFDEDPNTGTVWTEAGINALQSGVISVDIPSILIGVASKSIVTSVPGTLVTT